MRLYKEKNLIDFDWVQLKASHQKIIYLLVDPRPDIIHCYVGQTHDKDRFKVHFRRDKWRQTPKRIWIDQLLDLGLIPEIHVLEICCKMVADKRERYWLRIFEYSPMHILVNGYLERVSAGRGQVQDITPPAVGQKPGVLADLSFIIDLTQAYQVWLMKKTAFITCQIADINIESTIWKYWERKLDGRQFQIVDAGSGNLQHPFINKVPEQCKIVGVTEFNDGMTTRKRLGLCVS